MVENATHEKWICLECWKRMVAKPGQAPPFPSMRMICDECGAQKVLVTIRPGKSFPSKIQSLIQGQLVGLFSQATLLFVPAFLGKQRPGPFRNRALCFGISP